MFGLKLVRGDLQAQLLRDVQASSLAHTVDPSGFIVVADADTGALERLAFAIGQRFVGATSSRDWFTRGGWRDHCDSERTINQSRGVPFVEFETITDRLHPRLPAQPKVRHMFSLLIRKEASLPKGQRPWDRK